MKIAHQALAKLTGKNLQSTPKEVIVDQLMEPRALPMGRKEFDEWSERIISGALIPNSAGKVFQVAGLEREPNHQIHVDSQKFALANILMHLGPTESHKPDAYFIHCLRKFAVNQVADTIRKEIHEAAKVRTAEQEKKEVEEIKD